MNEADSKIEIKLVARADTSELRGANRDFEGIDKAANRATDALKKVEQQAEKTAATVNRAAEVVNKGAKTSIPSSLTSRSREDIRRAYELEREEGLRVEREMQREDEERAVQAKAARDAQRQQEREERRKQQAEDYAARRQAEINARGDEVNRRINERAAAALQQKAAEVQEARDRTQAEIDRRRRRTSSFISDQAAVRARNQEIHESSALDGVSPTRSQILGATAGAAAAAGVAAKAFHELNEQQSASQELAAAMYNRGIASDDFFQRLHRVAEEIRKDTGTKNSTWIGVLSELVSSGANEGNIDKLAGWVKNLAGIMNGNIPGAAQAMERAMQGNFETLTRWGIVVPETATQAQKLESALKQLAERGAGLMESRSKTLAGQWDNLKNSGYNLMAAFADTFTHSELLKQSMAGLGAVMQKAAEWIGLPVPKLEALNTKLVASSQGLEQAKNAARKAAEEYNSLAQQADRATQAMDRQARAEQAIRTAQENIATAQRDLRQAQIDAAVHSGAITPEQGQIQSAALTLQFERGRFMRNQQAQDDTRHAAEARLNQLGTQHGMLTSEAADVQRQLEQFQQAHAARADLANWENTLRQAEAHLAEIQNRPTAAAAAASGGEVSMMGPFRNPTEEARAQELLNATRDSVNRRRAEVAGLPNITDTQGAALQERMARLTTAITDLAQIMQRETPGLQDTIGQARLSHDANAVIFQAVQQTIGTQLNDHLSQTPVQSGNLGQLRAALQAPDQEQLLGALRAAIILRNEAMTTGFTEIIQAINGDIRNIQAQLRILSTRR